MSNVQQDLRISSDEVRAELIKVSETIPWGNKVGRFTRTLSERLELELTVDGFNWACERVLMDKENDFDRFDRKNIRDVLPNIANRIFHNSPEFLRELLLELERIKKGTHNLD